MLYELQLFNQGRLDASMAWVSKEFDRILDQYDVVKVHALADVLHVFKHHRPIIGGTFKKMKYGPVARDSLNRAKAWALDENSPMVETGTVGNRQLFSLRSTATRESMFTASERDTLLDSAQIVFGMTWRRSQQFFHGELIHGRGSSLGRAWKATPILNAPISWDLIINAYAEITGETDNAGILSDLLGT